MSQVIKLVVKASPKARQWFSKACELGCYCVSTATLVEPRTVPPPSLNSTKMRLLAGSNGTLPVAFAKIATVGVALALIVKVTLGPTAELHWPDCGSVWHRLMLSGSDCDPVFAVAVIWALAPNVQR
jgi:hypothetical protein